MASTTAPRTGMPHLNDQRIDLKAYRASAREELLSSLASAAPHGTRGGLALVLDPSLSGPLGLVAEVREFREHGVDKIYHLLPEPLQTECAAVAYLVRPHLRLAEQVASQIRAAEKARKRDDPPRQYTILFVPRRSMACEKVLADEGVHGLLSVQELPLPLFVLEEDVLSLEYPQSFRECFHDDDRSVLHSCASSLARMQAQYGRFRTVRGKGECAQSVIRLMQQMSEGLENESGDTKTPSSSEAASSALGGGNVTRQGMAAHRDSTGGATGGAEPPPAASAASIAELLVIDRDVDLVTPLCTELTYEGLIHQVFGIAHGYVDLDPSILAEEQGKAGASGAATRSTKRELNNNDSLYGTIRNLNFGELGPLLNKLARGVSDGYEERHQAQTVTQIRDYMKKLSKLQQEHKSLSMHVALAERIQRVTKQEAFHRRLECEQDALANATCSADSEAHLENMASAGEPLPSVLRLLCLLSLVSNGLRAKTFTAMQSELTHAYGFEKLALTWPVLTRLGLLKKQEGRSSWPTLKKSLRLVVEGMPDHEYPDDAPDMAYVYAGYAPLSVRLAHAMVAQPPTLDDTMRLLPGPYVSHTQRPEGADSAIRPASASAAVDASESAVPVTLVFFVGGCTFAEIAALRWLGRNGTPRREYIVATTHICTGDSLMESLVDTCDNRLETAAE